MYELPRSEYGQVVPLFEELQEDKLAVLLDQAHLSIMYACSSWANRALF
jgi:hypothetical protein